MILHQTKKLQITKFVVAVFISIFFFSSCDNTAKKDTVIHPDDVINIKAAGEVVAELTVAPNVPKPLEYTSPRKVKVRMEVIEKVMRLADGVDYTF